MSKLVFKSTTSKTLNDRFSKMMESRPRDISSSHREERSLRPGSEKNRRFAEQLERQNSARRRPAAHNRIGDIGQGSARAFASAIPQRSPMNYGRVQKRLGAPAPARRNNPVNNAQSQRILQQAQSMLRDTERELNMLDRQAKQRQNNNRGGGRGGGQNRQQNKQNNRGNSRGGRGGRGRGGGRGGRNGGDRAKPKSADALDAELDAFMMGTKAGLDKQMDDYMSGTKNGLDKEMDEYMAQKNSA